MRAFATLPLLLSFAACWNPRYFEPREHNDAISPDRTPAALYALPADRTDAPAAGEVRVWSRGARARFTDDDREVVELHVGFEVENNGTDELQLDLGVVACEELMLDGVLQPPLSPLRITGDGTAAAGQTARVDLLFEPAAGVPRDIDSFAVRFAVKAGNRVVVQQVTPFVPWIRSWPADRYAGGLGWGWGFGLGFGWHHSMFCCR